MFARPLSPILTISDNVALKNLIPNSQDKMPVTQLRYLMELRNRDETIRESLFTESEITFEQQINWYKNFIFDFSSGIYMIHHGSNFAGWLNYNDMDLNNKRCEVGIKIAESYQGRGLGRITFEYWVDTLFKYYALNKIYLNVMKSNVKAINLYHSLGFYEEANLIQHYWKRGHFIDCVVMYVLAQDFSPSTLVENG